MCRCVGVCVCVHVGVCVVGRLLGRTMKGQVCVYPQQKEKKILQRRGEEQGEGSKHGRNRTSSGWSALLSRHK